METASAHSNADACLLGYPLPERVSEDITALLMRWGHGERPAIGEVFSAVYQQLHRLAGNLLRRNRPGYTLQTTALVHEAFLRFSRGRSPDWRDRTHFFAVSARLMRFILLDHARAHQRHGGRHQSLTLNGGEYSIRGNPVDFLVLHDALEALGRIDPRKERVVELRFLVGLSVEDTAAVLTISEPTVIRDTRMAKAWLFREIYGKEGHGS